MRHWIPQQHGAWAMLIVPFVLGAIPAARAGALGWGHGTLFAFWILGYFSFNAASGWLKAAPRRRGRYLRPLVVYGTASAVFGVATLILVGTRPLPWTLAFVPLIVPALVLAGRRKERATVGGLLTVAAASFMVPVARWLYPSPLDDWPRIAALTALVFGYFFGTVLFVKTNLRERGSRGYLAASIAHHVVLAGLSFLLAGGGLVGWWWVAVLLFVLVRTIVLPPLRWRPMALGLIEVAVCTVIIGCALTLG